MRKKVRVLIHEEFQTLCERGKEYQSSQLLRISGEREFELRNLSENSELCMEQRQNIRYHRCEKFRMSQVTNFLMDHVYLLILEQVYIYKRKKNKKKIQKDRKKKKQKNKKIKK